MVDSFKDTHAPLLPALQQNNKCGKGLHLDMQHSSSIFWGRKWEVID